MEVENCPKMKGNDQIILETSPFCHIHDSGEEGYTPSASLSAVHVCRSHVARPKLTRSVGRKKSIAYSCSVRKKPEGLALKKNDCWNP